MSVSKVSATLGFSLVLVVTPCVFPQAALAQSRTNVASQGGGFFDDWFAMVSETQAAQPHWITPVATTTPRLEQEFRYDIFRQPGSTGTTTENYGGGKGVEFIPEPNIEVIVVAPPAYIVHNNPALRDGFGDWGFLVKYRVVAANEEHGSFIFTLFLQTTFPTGQYKNGSTNPIVTPTIAYGKGFGRFDMQGTFGVALPTASEERIGRKFLWNNAFQYHVAKKLWPEVEVNYTHFQDGPDNGRTQVFMTPGILFARFHLWKELGLTAGAGFQIATTHFHANNHNEIFTVRFPF